MSVNIYLTAINATPSQLLAFFNNQVVRLQENTSFDLFPRCGGQGHLKHRTVCYTKCDMLTTAKYGVATFNPFRGYAFT